MCFSWGILHSSLHAMCYSGLLFFDHLVLQIVLVSHPIIAIHGKKSSLPGRCSVSLPSLKWTGQEVKMASSSSCFLDFLSCCGELRRMITTDYEVLSSQQLSCSSSVVWKERFFFFEVKNAKCKTNYSAVCLSSSWAALFADFTRLLNMQQSSIGHLYFILWHETALCEKKERIFTPIQSQVGGAGQRKEPTRGGASHPCLFHKICPSFVHIEHQTRCWNAKI